MSITRTSFKFEVSSLKLKGDLHASGLETSNFKLQTSNFKPQTSNSQLRKSAGLSLVELIVFIVVVGLAVAGVLGALSLATRASADPMIQKQALAIAEALLEEVELRPFTFCDPDDANAATATTAQLDSVVTPPAVGCATTVEVMGPEAGPETRAAAPAFDNVNDYFKLPPLTLVGISDLNGTA